MEDETRKFMEHFPEGIGEDIKSYVNDEALRYKNYIFTEKIGKKQNAYCTYCKNTFETTRLKHNSLSVSPNCDYEYVVKSSAYGRKYMIDEAYFIYYEKSLVNKEAIIARGIYVVRDYNMDYKSVETKYLVVAWYLFEMGKREMYRNDGYYTALNSTLHRRGAMQSYNMRKCASVYSLSSTTSKFGQVPQFCSYKSIKKAVKGTPFFYSTWEDYKAIDKELVSFFANYAKYPCIEYLTKLGLSNLVISKLERENFYHVVNWRGKTLNKVLKLSNEDFKEIKAANIDIDIMFLRLYQLTKKESSKISINTIIVLRKILHSPYTFITFEFVYKYSLSIVKLYNYLEKQKIVSGKAFNSLYSILSDWRDYINDCLKLEMDITKERVLYPKDLHAAHIATIKKIRYKADNELNMKIKAVGKKLYKKYYFEFDGLFIRPALSYNELIRESSKLNHCVGNYAVNYSNQATNLLFLRRLTKPDVPYFTVEIIGDEIVQVRGKDNCIANKKVERFIEVFKSKKLKISKAGKKLSA